MQLFAHLLSSYLQGMGDFFSALPRGGSPYLLCLRMFSGTPSPWGRLGWGFYVGWYAPLATLTELRLHSPGLRAQPATLGNAPTNIATL